MLSLPHLLVLLLVVLVVFGAGRISRVMGDIGKGIRSFREGLNGEDSKKIEDKDKNDQQ